MLQVAFFQTAKLLTELYKIAKSCYESCQSSNIVKLSDFRQVATDLQKVVQGCGGIILTAIIHIMNRVHGILWLQTRETSFWIKGMA